EVWHAPVEAALGGLGAVAEPSGPSGEEASAGGAPGHPELLAAVAQASGTDLGAALDLLAAVADAGGAAAAQAEEEPETLVVSAVDEGELTDASTEPDLQAVAANPAPEDTSPRGSRWRDCGGHSGTAGRPG
ncbi:unnamed protein product, partial [Prorocentrum cordatum]